MAYIGVQPTDTYLSIASQQITGNGGATYTLDYSVSDEESVAVFVNNVRQNVSSYTVSSNQLTLGGTISASDSCWILFLGRTVGTKTPAVGSVTNDMLAGSIATSKLADGSTFATTNGITQADQWRLTTSVTTNGEITSGFERVDTGNFNYIGTGMTVSSGVFTFPSTGIYLIHYSARINVVSGDSGFLYATVATDGSTFGNNLGYLYQTSGSGTGGGTSANIGFFDVTNTSTHKVRFEAVSLASGSSISGNTSETATGFTFIRLGDT